MVSPLEHRIFKIKKPTMRFFCPLCRTERAFKSRPRLSAMNFIQIILITAVLILTTYNYFPKTEYIMVSYFFLVWGCYEFAVRTIFRKEIPCPHCGLDASWYKRDIKVAKRLVEDFWEKKKSDQAGELNAPPVTPSDDVISEYQQ